MSFNEANQERKRERESVCVCVCMCDCVCEREGKRDERETIGCMFQAPTSVCVRERVYGRSMYLKSCVCTTFQHDRGSRVCDRNMSLQGLVCVCVVGGWGGWVVWWGG